MITRRRETEIAGMMRVPYHRFSLTAFCQLLLSSEDVRLDSQA
jgi:hypothetical protein